MADSNILSDFGIKILEQEIDDVIFQTNEFLCDATFTGSQGPFWWILQMCMALAALFSIVVAGIGHIGILHLLDGCLVHLVVFCPSCLV
jgi:hypothetical protein